MFLRDYYVNATAKTDMHIITHDVKRAVRESGVMDGVVHILATRASSGVALLEEDKKIHQEYCAWIEAQFPESEGKRPARRSGSGKNSAHLRAACVGSQLSLPVQQGRLMNGHWQEVVLFDFDDKIGRCEVRIYVSAQGAEKA